MADWSKLGNFEVTTPIADLLQDISDKGIPTSKDEVSQVCCANSTLPLTGCCVFDAHTGYGDTFVVICVNSLVPA